MKVSVQLFIIFTFDLTCTGKYDIWVYKFGKYENYKHH